MTRDQQIDLSAIPTKTSTSSTHNELLFSKVEKSPTTCSVPLLQGLQLSCAVRSLNLPFATRWSCFTCSTSSTCHNQGVTSSRQNACQNVNPVNVVWVEPFPKFWFFVETIGTDIKGDVVAVGGECYLMYFSEADVTDLRKPQLEGIAFSP